MADSNSQSQSSSVKNICDNALNSDSFFSEIAQSSASVRHSITHNQFAFRATDSFFSFPTQSTLPNLPSPSPFQTTFANTPCSHTDASPAPDSNSTMHLSLPTPNPWATVDLSPFHSTSLSISPQAPFSMRLSASMPDMLLPLPVPTPPSTGIQFSSSVPDSLPSSVQLNPSRSTERSGSSRSVHSLDGESHESSRSDSGAESGKKRTQIQRACVHCRRHKTRCDEQRPCGRCSRLGRASTCVDFVPTSSRFCQPKKKKTAKNDSPKSLNLNLAELKPFMGSTSSSPSYSPSPAISPPISSSLPSPPSIEYSPLLASSLSQGLSDSAHSTPRLSLPQSLAVPSLLSSVPQGPSMAPSARLPWFDLLGPTILELDRRAKAAESPLPLDIATAMAWMTGYVKRRLLLNRPLDLASTTVSPVRTSNIADLPPITSSVTAVDLLKSDLSSAFALGTFASSTSLSAPVTSSVTAPSASFSLLCSLSSGAIGSSSAAAGSQSIPARSAGDSPLSAYDGLKAQHWMSTKECGMLAIVNNWRLTYDQIDPILQSTQQTSSVEQLRSRFDKEKAQTQRLPFGVVIYPLNLSGSLPGRANAYMAGLLGYDQTHFSSLLSLDPSRVFTAASLDRIDARICRMLLDGESFSTFAVTALTSDGREVQMIQSVSIKGIDGMPLYSVSFFQLRPSAGGMAVGNTILSE